MMKMFSYTSRLSRAAASAACKKAKQFTSMSPKARRAFRPRTSRTSNEIDFQQGVAFCCSFSFLSRGQVKHQLPPSAQIGGASRELAYDAASYSPSSDMAGLSP